MTVQTQKLAKGLKTAGQEVLGFATSLKGIVVEAGAVAGIYKLIDIAGSMEQQINRTKIVFGQFSDEVISQSEKMAIAFGSSKKEFIAGAATLGTLLKAEGYADEGASYLSAEFVKAAMNASRFTGIPLEEYLSKIGAALAGHARGLHTIGIVMDDDRIKAEALKLGLIHVGEELTQSAKSQATASLLMQGLAKSSGQLGSNVNTVAGLMAAFTGRIENLTESIATALLPLIGPGGEIQVGLQALQMAFDDYGASAIKASADVVFGTQQQIGGMSFLQKSIGFIANAWWAISTAFKGVQVLVTGSLVVITTGLGLVSKGIDFVLTSLGFAETGATKFLDEIAAGLTDLGQNQIQEFQNKLNEPWPSDSIDAYFENARKKIAETRGDLAKTQFDLKKGGIPTGPAAVQKPIQFAKAESFASKEAANTILRSKYGNNQNNQQAKIAQNTQQTVDVLKQIAQKIGESVSPFQFIPNF